MTVRLKQHKGLMKTIAVIAALVLSGWLYREFHPTIIFHTPQESKYLGKIVCTADGDLEKLYIETYLWSWNEDDEAAVFIDNYGDVIRKEDLDFWKLDIYLDENNCYQSHSKTEYCWGLRYILQSKTDK